MTQNQVAYMNAVTQRENLKIAQQQADAATAQAAASTMQAETARNEQRWKHTWGFGSDLVTGALSTAGGLLAAALL